jgi:gluconokinase
MFDNDENIAIRLRTCLQQNDIEYGMMQAYVEGFEIMRAKQEFNMDIHAIALTLRAFPFAPTRIFRRQGAGSHAQGLWRARRTESINRKHQMNITTVAADAAEAPLILTIDIGSSSARAPLYDRSGRMVEGIGARARYEILTTTAGAAEVDPDWLVEQAARCVDIVLMKAGKLAQQIAAVAIDTLVTSIVAVDAAGQALTPLITYADTRNAEDAAALRAALDEAALHDRTGCLLRTSYWPARLAWFRRTQPEIWRRAARWLTLGEYLELRLFGRCRVSYSAASWSGLLDRRQLAWDAPLLATLALTPEHLSPLVDCDAPLTGLIQPYAGRWPLLHDVPWFPAIGDGAAANVGSGCTDHRRMALTLGTTGAIRVIQTGLTPTPPGLWSYRVDREHHLVGGRRAKAATSTPG